jgi:hypothetical protein
MIRSWGPTLLTGSAQPWFGDVLTAAVVPPTGQNNLINVTVASTTRYRVGDRIYLDPGQTTQDILLVSKIVSATVLGCQTEGQTINAHANGALVQLCLAVIDVQIQAVDGNAGTVWLGSDKTVTVKGGSAFRQLQKVAGGLIPADWQSTRGGTNNIARTDDGWMIGTASDYVCMMAEVL